jgi:hypothetical protein
MAYGMGGAVGITMQQSFGTAYTTGMKFQPFISESITESIPPVIVEGLRGIYDDGDSLEGPHEISGDIVFEIDPCMIGYWLKGFCHSTSYETTTVTSYYYTHEFMPAQDDFDAMAATPPMTIEAYRDAGSAFQYHSCCVNALTFEFAHGALIKSTVGIIGAGLAMAAKQTATYEPFSEFTWDQTSISLAGAAVDEIVDMTVTMTNNLEAVSTIDGTTYPNRIQRAGKRTIEISGTILFIDEAEANIFRAQTERRLVVTTQQGCNAINLDIPSMRYNAFPVNMGGPGKIAVGFTASAKYNAGSGTAIQITTTVHSLASY